MANDTHYTFLLLELYKKEVIKNILKRLNKLFFFLKLMFI
jgi:hypothetical protein